MSSTGMQKRRNKFTRVNTPVVKATGSGLITTEENHVTGRKHNKFTSQQQDKMAEKENAASWSLLSAANVLLGIAVMIGVSYMHARYMFQLHEGQLWFSNIQEVEREISFRTESGLFYSYYKQLVQSPSMMEGMQELMEDTKTEHPDTINVLERMNIYQEVILAFVYRILGPTMRPIFFYTYFIFGLHACLVSGLYLTAWLLSGSWPAGLLTAVFYMFNRLDTTRVESSVPLRENFALPFLWLQASMLTVYFKPNVLGKLKVLSLTATLLCTFFFCLFWQFNQFIMMLQAFSLFGVWVLGLVPAYKVRNVFLCQLASLLAVCLLQFGNRMILSSFALSFIISSLLMISFMGDQDKPHSVLLNMVKVASLSLLSLTMMILLSMVVKSILNVDSDEHIFKFIQNKFGVGDVKDFDSRLYLCLGIFGFITWDIFERLTQNFVLPFYVLSHVILLGFLVFGIFKRWIRILKEGTDVPGQLKNIPEDSGKDAAECLIHRPDLAFHTVQALFFGALAVTTMRMKYLWTPYMCVLATVGVADSLMWIRLLSLLNVTNKNVIEAIRLSVVVVILSVMMTVLLPGILKELKHETEFWDPDTVELMNWIIKNTPAAASFTGSMQLLAGVKLCTGRHITNHPHYEDKHLRQKTKELYQIYGRRKPKDVYKILTKYKSDYIILEDSICRAPSRDGCRLPDLVDIDNGVMPDEPVNIQGLQKSSVLRFCEHVRYQDTPYAKYFVPVFENKTFRMYRVV